MDGIEYWDLERKKRLGLFHIDKGNVLLAICLNSQTNKYLSNKKTYPNEELFQTTRILTTEDSYILRIWSPTNKAGRIMTKQNDIVTCILKVEDFSRRHHNLNLFITGSCDGAIKAYTGERKNKGKLA